MANACKVPWWHLNFRGQGIKVASIVFEECNKRNFRMLTYYENDNSGSGWNEAQRILYSDSGDAVFAISGTALMTMPTSELSITIHS